MNRQWTEPDNSVSQIEVLRSFLDELVQADSTLFHRTAFNSRAPGGRRTAARLEAKLRQISSFPVKRYICGGLLATHIPPGMVFNTMNALVRLVGKLMPSEYPPLTTTDKSDASTLASNTLADLTLLCLANLLESLSWRHVFFRVLDEVQLEQRRAEYRGSTMANGGGCGCQELIGTKLSQQRPSPVTLQEYLWRKIVTDKPAATGRDNGAGGRSAGKADTGEEVVIISSSPGALVSPVNRPAVRLCCNMVRHCPLSFPASSYSSLAPQLVDYLIGRGKMYGIGYGSVRGGNGSCAATETVTVVDQASDADLMVLLDLFAACVRGSPHFRQCVKGLRRKRELFRLLLAFLVPHPRRDGRIVVRALCGLARVLSGDALEAKVFERGNALETASLVMENLLDVSGCSMNDVGRSRESCGAGDGALGEQRRFADVASDIARSRVFTSVLLETGRLACFLRDAVTIFSRAAAEVSANALLNFGGALSLGWGGSEEASVSQRLTTPEPLLCALCSFCMEHSPARSAFIQALLGLGGGGNVMPPVAAAAATLPPPIMHPCKALFVLCLHPHIPTASAASALVQCLLVGGGALGAVSGPSSGAAAGVGVIPAVAHRFRSGGVWAGGGIGREDPLQAALLKKMSDVALGGCERRDRGKIDANDYKVGENEEERQDREDLVTDATSVADSSDCSSSEREVNGGWCADRGLDEPIGLGGVVPLSGGSSSPAASPGALLFLLRRLGQIGTGLASAQAKQELGLAREESSVDHSRKRAEEGSLPLCDQGLCAASRALRARAVEAEQEITSILCLLSSSALASPTVARVLGRTTSLETALTPILAAQRGILAGADPADYSRAPVEIVLVSLTLIAQLALALSDRGCGYGRIPAARRMHGAKGADSGSDSSDSVEDGRDDGRRRWRNGRGQVVEKSRMGREWDSARAVSLRRFLGEQAATVEIKLCVGHAACRAESKDLARRVASLVSLLQTGGGADALLVADALYSFAQSAESREAGLRSRVVAAEAAACRERAAGARRAVALEESEELVAQMDVRNTEELRRVSEEGNGARRRLQEAHKRALARGEASLRRVQETADDLERALRAKEDALRRAGRDARAKDLEIASLRGDLAGEARLRTAAEFKLEAACSQREELRRGKAEAENLVEDTKNDLREAREEIRKASAECEAERAAARRNDVAARHLEEELQRSNARAEEAYGKLILLARSYKNMEEESQGKVAETEERLAGAVSETKAARAQAREEERRHRITKTAAKDVEDALKRSEDRLVRVSTEAAEAQAKAVAARAVAREAREEASASAREVALRRDENVRLKAELERSRAACAEKDLRLAEKGQELGQQAGIIEYINKLSSSKIAGGTASALVPGPAVAVHADRVTSVSPNPEGDL